MTRNEPGIDKLGNRMIALGDQNIFNHNKTMCLFISLNNNVVFLSEDPETRTVSMNKNLIPVQKPQSVTNLKPHQFVTLDLRTSGWLSLTLRTFKAPLKMYSGVKAFALIEHLLILLLCVELMVPDIYTKLYSNKKMCEMSYVYCFLIFSFMTYCD